MDGRRRQRNWQRELLHTAQMLTLYHKSSDSLLRQHQLMVSSIQKLKKFKSCNNDKKNAHLSLEIQNNSIQKLYEEVATTEPCVNVAQVTYITSFVCVTTSFVQRRSFQTILYSLT